MDTPAVTRTALLDAPAQEVWEAITDGDALAAWLDASVEIDIRPGGVGRVGHRSVLVTEVDEGHHLSMLWWDGEDGVVTSVEFSLAPVAAGTEFTVIERLSASPGVGGPTGNGPVASARAHALA